MQSKYVNLQKNIFRKEKVYDRNKEQVCKLVRACKTNMFTCKANIFYCKANTFTCKLNVLTYKTNIFMKETVYDRNKEHVCKLAKQIFLLFVSNNLRERFGKQVDHCC